MQFSKPKWGTIAQWGGIVALLIVLLTDLRTPVLGSVQQGLLATGLWRPTLPPAPAQTPVQATRTSYPHNLSLLTLDGKPANLRDLQGKVVLVNLWASWCPPCMAEMPGLQKLYHQVDKRKVAFVMISLDQNPDKARRVVARKGYTFPVYFPAAPLPPAFDSESIPTTLIVGPNGQIAARHEGMADYDTPEFKAALEKLAGSARL
ncbi:TlpA family protein disulfide reductase [Hymenobacter sp. HSC-4F20]|uniref:TlpA family protein disulfide reductase n=1 Tax=Hymenobacter sp. HSC-4F20 TaxID=2864135 RepID=UPI001C7344B0|nr:TlpA disulfide reductase family protein [Hymenobacter sp. HSC-4F20]MBX0291637.1 TlpA family protein disulfide reductase [Hymenobacter sp. HSC-4F20]